MIDKKPVENKVKVHILNKEYVIKTKGKSEQYVLQLAKTVNEQMEQIQGQNPVLSRDDVATLTALNLVDELFTLRKDYEELTLLIEEHKGI